MKLLALLGPLVILLLLLLTGCDLLGGDREDDTDLPGKIVFNASL